MVVADFSGCINEVVGWPKLVAECLPDAVFIVESNRVGDVQFLDRAAHVIRVLFEGELGGINANDDEATVCSDDSSSGCTAVFSDS